jgi:hypothetical protein
MKNTEKSFVIGLAVFLVLTATACSPGGRLVGTNMGDFAELNVAQKATFFMQVYSEQYDIYQRDREREELSMAEMQTLEERRKTLVEMEKLIRQYNHYVYYDLHPRPGIESELLLKAEKLFAL